MENPWKMDENRGLLHHADGRLAGAGRGDLLGGLRGARAAAQGARGGGEDLPLPLEVDRNERYLASI